MSRHHPKNPCPRGHRQDITLLKRLHRSGRVIDADGIVHVSVASESLLALLQWSQRRPLKYLCHTLSIEQPDA